MLIGGAGKSREESRDIDVPLSVLESSTEGLVDIEVLLLIGYASSIGDGKWNKFPISRVAKSEERELYPQLWVVQDKDFFTISDINMNNTQCT